MTTLKQPPRPDGFDILLAGYKNSTYEYEDHDADLRDVLRPWSRLSAEGKLGYIARDAALYNAPFERFEQAAREMLGGQALPAGERAYLRLHMEYQRALWDHELPAFPREHPIPKDDPHHEALDAIDGVLHVKFERLLDDYLNSTQPFADADGHMRRWPELSAEGKVQHIARLAAIFSQPLSRFTEAVRDALDGQSLHTNETACLRLQYNYAQQIRDPHPHPLPLAQTASNLENARTQDLWVRGSIDPMLTELEAFGDEFERLARSPEQRHLASSFKDWIAGSGRTLSALNTASLREQLFGDASQATEPQPEHHNKRQQKR